jgi:hypothetical protein
MNHKGRAVSDDGLRLNAYVLAADPSWVEESVAAYYPHVERIVVSYDKTGTSWTGVSISTEECLARLRAIDVESKIDFRPGSYYRPGFHPLENETYQRQAALDAASGGADWVLQLDTDEVLGDPNEFLSSLHAAHERGFTGLEYPSRILYQHVRGRLYLEQCTRLWAVSAHYPGPMAVAAGSRLVHCRQADVQLFRVDFKERNTDPAHPSDAPVHRVVRQAQGIIHYSWVRSESAMQEKVKSTGHAYDFDWDGVVHRWRARGRHPVRTVAGTPFRWGEDRRFVRLATIAGAPDKESRMRNGMQN